MLPQAQRRQSSSLPQLPLLNQNDAIDRGMFSSSRFNTDAGSGADGAWVDFLTRCINVLNVFGQSVIDRPAAGRGADRDPATRDKCVHHHDWSTRRGRLSGVSFG